MRVIFILLLGMLIGGAVVVVINYGPDGTSRFVGDAQDIGRNIAESAPSHLIGEDVSAEDRFNRSELEQTIYYLVNEYRMSQGLRGLQWDDDLVILSKMHSVDMATHSYSEHIDSSGNTPTGRARNAGYYCRNSRSIGVAENIHVLFGHTARTDLGWGRTEFTWMEQDDLAVRFVDDWIRSPGHRRNLLDQRYRLTGIGIDFGSYWNTPNAVFVTQKFC